MSIQTATLAAGCFWGVEEILRQIPGVIDTSVGYIGGHTEMPDYKKICRGDTGHAEAVQLRFDSNQISFEKILDYFFRLHDPTTPNRQGNDVGSQYRSAIFYQDEQQREIALKVKNEVEKSGKWKRPLVTEIVPAGIYYPAEEYHQKYLQKNPDGYHCHYLRD